MRFANTRCLTMCLTLALLVGSTCVAAAQTAQPAAPQVATKEACSDAYSDSQLRRRNNELLLARQKLRLCASEACPSFARNDCADWLGQVEKAIPSVVLEAKDDKGYVFDVTVTMDGAVLATQLDGKPIDIDPGAHIFRFVRASTANNPANSPPNNPPIEQQIIVHAGEKGRPVTASWVTPKAAPPAGSETSARREAPEVPMERPVPKVAYVLGGVGIVGLGAFTYFGLSGNAKKSSLSSSCSPFCSDSDVSGVQTRYLVADIALAVGVVSLATAAVLIVTRPERPIAAALRTPPLQLRLQIQNQTGAAVTGGLIEWARSF
jgi:hypothetical protein